MTAAPALRVVPPPFNLPAFLARELNGRVGAPLALARKAYLAIPPGQRDEALMQALCIVISRRNVPRGETVDQPTPRPGPAPAPRVPRTSVRSWKVDAIREHWRDQLAEVLWVGQTQKPLAECTYADLQSVSNRHLGMVEHHRVIVDRLTLWALLVRQHQVDTFGELPEPVLEEALAVQPS